jgi:hypothetical protein
VRYLETQAAAIGLKPVIEGAATARRSPSKAEDLLPAAAALRGGRQDASPPSAPKSCSATPAARTDTRAGRAAGLRRLRHRRAGRKGWNDYKGVDVKGKMLVMMVNDPQPTAAEPNRFGGKAYTWYGRWLYKFEEAVRQGAAGALLIHTTPSASYPWSVPVNSFRTSSFHLAGAGNRARGLAAARTARSCSRPAARTSTSCARAPRARLPPVDLNASAHAQVKSAVRQVEPSSTWPASCPAPTQAEAKQAVIYSAHWDHLGIDEGGIRGKTDHIWNGAIDNASGTAAAGDGRRRRSSIRRAAPRSSCGRRRGTGPAGQRWPMCAPGCGRWRRRPPT